MAWMLSVANWAVWSPVRAMGPVDPLRSLQSNKIRLQSSCVWPYKHGHWILVECVYLIKLIIHDESLIENVWTGRVFSLLDLFCSSVTTWPNYILMLLASLKPMAFNTFPNKYHLFLVCRICLISEACSVLPDFHCYMCWGDCGKRWGLFQKVVSAFYKACETGSKIEAIILSIAINMADRCPAALEFPRVLS